MAGRIKGWRVIAGGVLTIAVLTGCGKKAPRELPPPPVGSGEAGADDGAGHGTGSVADAELEALRRDFVQRSGSDTVYFVTDSHVLDAASRVILDAQAAWLLAHPSVRISVEGHCDERGTREYNLALGERRANAAKNYLAARGVPAGRMTTISWGKERPVAEGSSEEAWARNRRAVTVLPAAR